MSANIEGAMRRLGYSIEEVRDVVTAYGAKEGLPPNVLKTLRAVAAQLTGVLDKYGGEEDEYPKPKTTTAIDTRRKGADSQQLQHQYALESMVQYMAEGDKDEPGMDQHYFSSKQHDIQQRALGSQGFGRFFDSELASESQKAAEGDEHLRKVRQRLGYESYWKLEADDE